MIPVDEKRICSGSEKLREKFMLREKYVTISREKIHKTLKKVDTGGQENTVSTTN
jgi:uncharacterized protein YnzC (UPF0291/DUF896 family)